MKMKIIACENKTDEVISKEIYRREILMQEDKSELVERILEALTFLEVNVVATETEETLIKILKGEI